MTLVVRSSRKTGELEPQKAAEPSWAPALRVACSTMVLGQDSGVSAVSVGVTLTGMLADVGALVVFSQSLATEHGLHAELQSFAPPTFTVRFSRNGTEASTFEGAEP